ncbi:hypothetical protein HY407_01175 [Candidatus Gottesmanbacteria bacterium]|nr:hypothetical protein [Candidatus Gottesmanbacteria bacterium]
MITISAPGKVILMGEHSVVYGKPALVAAIDKRLYVTIEPSLQFELGSEDHIEHILSLFQKTFNKDIKNLKISLKSEIPEGKHIGSSAALAVALIGALMRHILKIWDPLKINELAYKAEKKTHSNPSGADNTASCFGGLVWYRKEFEFLKSIWKLPIASYKIPQFVLIDTGKPRESTAQMVRFVAQLYGKKPKYLEEIFTNQEIQTKRLLISLKEANLNDLKKTIMIGERNLEKIGVVSNSSKLLIRKIEKIGGAAKICGGGGKTGPTGIILAYHEDISKLINLAQKNHLPAFITKLGEEGVRVENG